MRARCESAQDTHRIRDSRQERPIASCSAGPWLLASLVLLLLAPSLAHGALHLYASESDDSIRSHPANPANEAVPATFSDGKALIHVYFDNGGSYAGYPDQCTPASTGDEICQWAVRFETTGNLVIADIAWGDAELEDDEPTTPATSRSGTGGRADYGTVGASKLATVSLMGTFGQLRLTTPTGYGFVHPDGSVTTATSLDATGYLVIAEASTLPWQTVSTTSATNCGILGSGEVECWGTDFSGSPAPPPGAFREVATTTTGACAIDYEGVLTCWGDVGTPIAGPYRQLAAGADGHMCGLGYDLEITCWKGVTYGDDPIETGVPGGPFLMVSRGGLHSCALRLDGTAVCWGDDTYGQVTGVLGDAFTDLAGGEFNACGLRPDGSIECWGRNTEGQSTPPAGTFSDLTAGSFHGCGIQSDASVTCWGQDTVEGRTSGVSAGVAFATVSASTNLTCGVQVDGGAVECWGADSGGSKTAPVFGYPQVAAGATHTCAIRPDRSLACWGENTGGGATASPPGGLFAQHASGKDFGCAVQEGGTVSCWGDNTSGKATPAGGTFTQVATGQDFACGLRPSGTIACWGDLSGGLATPPPGAYLQIAAGWAFACGIAQDGGVDCWGDDTYDQVSGAPAFAGFSELVAGGTHACAHYSTGEAACWGAVGYPTAIVTTPLLGDFEQIDAGGLDICGLRADGSPECWGNTVTPLSPPSIQLASLSLNSWSSESYSCGPDQSGPLSCWGPAAISGVTGAQPPLDSDADGIEDPADNCPQAANAYAGGTCIAADGSAVLGSSCSSDGACGPGESCSLAQEDSDFDGAGDACDLCVEANPDQLDPDGDGLGNVCDNCAGVANGPLSGTCYATVSGTPVVASSCTSDLECNPGETCDLGQLDFDGNGVGDMCQTAVLYIEALQGSGGEILGGGSSSGGLFESSGELPPIPDPHYLIKLACPATFRVGRVRLGLALPTEVVLATTHFTALQAVGGGYTYPGCTAVNCEGADPTLISANVDLTNSSVIRGDTLTGASDHTIFFTLYGKEYPPASGNPDLCHDNAGTEILAVVVAPTAPLGITPTVSENELVEAYPGVGEAIPFLDSTLQEVDGEDRAYATADEGQAVKILLSPALNDPTNTLYLVKLEANQEFQQITIGFRMSLGTLWNQVEFLGCPQQEAGLGTPVPCSDPGGLLLGPTVNAGKSWAEGPVTEADPSILYVTLFGNLDSEEGVFNGKTLNYAPGGATTRTLLGTLRMPQPGIVPTPTADGAHLLTGIPGTGSPYIGPWDENDPYDPLVEYGTGSVYLGSSGIASLDSDNDWITDDCDVCRHIWDRGQDDSGQLGSASNPTQASSPDGRGDACQCGEAGGDGQINLIDIDQLQSALLDPASNTAIIERCSVAGDAVSGDLETTCDIKDVITVKMAYEDLGAPVSDVCASSKPSQAGEQ